MTPPGTPRFRFRAPDGSEVPVGSVEDLSSRLEAGELGPETPLFDAGTGSWARAGDVPVFQFVLEELRAEGRLPEEEEVVVLPDPPPEEPIEAGDDFQPIRHDADAPKPLASPTVDPFELHLPLSNPMDPLEGRDAPRKQREGHGTEPGPGPGPGPEAGSTGSTSSDAGAGPDSEAEDGVAEASVERDAPKEPWFEDRPFTEAEIEPVGEAAGETSVEAPGEAPGEAPDEASEEAQETPGEAPGRVDPKLDPDIDPSPLHAWLTHGPPTPEPALPPRRDSPTEPAGENPDRRPVLGRSSARDEGVAAGRHSPRTPETQGIEVADERDASPLEIRTAWEDEGDAEDPRAARLAARKRRRNARVLAGMIAAAIVLIGGAAMFNATRTTGGPTGPDLFPGGPAGNPASDPEVAVNVVTPPAGLETEATLLWRDLAGQVAGVMDSLRGDAGLFDAPPRDWLGGYYLANAGEFPEVVEFWEGYRDFVGMLADQDAVLVRTAARRAMEAGTRPELEAMAEADRQRLVQYVADRHDLTRPARIDRFLHLQRTAEAALGLHEFLVENGALITHSPALGRGVSADPVLEAVTETPAVRREMEQHLDRIFEALDRTRGGGQPSLEGLRSELFGSLGRPL